MQESYFVNIDIEKELKDLDKYANYFFLMHYWMKNMENNRSIECFFEKRGYKKIAIYGMGYLGIHLSEQLPEAFKPIYTVDKGIVRYKGNSFPFEKSKDICSIADVIIITPVCEYDVIKKAIKCNVCDTVDIISLEEVILSV